MVEKIKITETRLEQYQKQISMMRSWLTGWIDAGKTPPPGSEVLWQIDMMLRNREAS